MACCSVLPARQGAGIVAAIGVCPAYRFPVYTSSILEADHETGSDRGRAAGNHRNRLCSLRPLLSEWQGNQKARLSGRAFCCPIRPLRSGSLCYVRRVKILSAIRSLLAIPAIVGLVLGPIARPAMALPAPMNAAAASDQAMVDEAAIAMPEDMPCCPKKSPIPDCGRDCVMMMCVTQFLCNAVQAASLVIPLGLASVFFPGNDTDVAGLSQGPPPRPPKI